MQIAKMVPKPQVPGAGLSEPTTDEVAETSPDERVCIASVRVNTIAKSRSFQASTNANSATVTIAGVDSGSTTRQRAPSREQPSIKAASSSSTGRLLK